MPDDRKQKYIVLRRPLTVWETEKFDYQAAAKILTTVAESTKYDAYPGQIAVEDLAKAVKIALRSVRAPSGQKPNEEELTRAFMAGFFDLKT